MERKRMLWIGAVGALVLLAALVVGGTRGSRSSAQLTRNTSSGAGYPASAPTTAAAMAEAPAADFMGEQAQANATGGATASQLALDSAAAQPAGRQDGSTDGQGFNRLVIKTADVTLEVEDVAQAEAVVRAKASELGGYIVQVQTYGADENRSSNITFRVPSAQFDAALAGVEGVATKVLGRTVSGDDVSEEFVDLESRLRNLDATRARLQTFLDKAVKVEDALAVNDSLTDVQGQIESIQGRMKYLTQSAALSTITVALQPVPALPQLTAEGGWQPLLVARNALSGLIGFGQGLAEIVIVLVVWSPVWGLLLLAGLWTWRRLRAPKPPRTMSESA